MPTVANRLMVLLVLVTLLGTGVPHLPRVLAAAGPDHLVISEVVTGGSSASDELIELYNPTAGALPLEGLELVYVSASGLTVSRRATWELGASDVPAGGHVLVAHELGVFATIADATYASGMAATGGSVALRIAGAASAIDAVGWGSAASTWLEGGAAPAPAAGSSLERLPGGMLGSTQDTNDNAVDFVVRLVPGPENSASPPVPSPTPSGAPEPSSPASPVPTIDITPSPQPSPPPSPAPTAQPTAAPTPGSEVVSIATARSLPDGTVATIEGVALSGSAFTDGGGYVADATGGLAVLLTDGSFARGDRLRVRGSIDDRYAQRTLRAVGVDVEVLGPSADPAPLEVATGEVGEGLEGRLVRIAGHVVGSPTALSVGLAFDVNDGSGAVRLLIGSATGIDVDAWTAGFAIDAIGVVGQRDSSGTGLSGYRVQPRDAADIRAVGPAPSQTDSPGPSPTSEPTPAPSQPADLISVAAARQLPKGAAAVVRGVVTLAPGLVDPTTAVLQDATGAIVLRVAEEAGSVARGSHVEVRGVRSTLSGMETLRVTMPPIALPAAPEPAARAVRTGEAGEDEEAGLILVRGGLVAAPRRSSAGTVTFEVDDGSGPLRVSIGSTAGIDVAGLAGGTWIEARGVLGQETTGSLPLRGYRLWPRDASDLRVTAPSTDGTLDGAAAGGRPSGGAGSATGRGTFLGSLDAIGGTAGGPPVGATLVVGPWKELGVGGLLWDGVRLVAIEGDAEPQVMGLLGTGRPPVALQASGLRVVGTHPSIGIPVVRPPDEPDALRPSGLPPAPPLALRDVGGDEPRWVSLVGRLTEPAGTPTLLAADASLPIDVRCDGEPLPQRRTVSVTGVLLGEPSRILVPCGGIAAAPLLTLATAIRAAMPPSEPTSTASPVGSESRSTVVPAALLLMAATTLAVGASVARWARRDGRPSPDAGAAAADEGAESPPPPVLTLVHMPRERAP